jgi:hypothetical protein
LKRPSASKPRGKTLPIHDISFNSGALPIPKSNYGTNSALFNAAREFPMPSIGSIGGKDDARGKHFCTCHEFTNALTEVLAENAVGLARRGRIARAHAAVRRHPEYNEHALCVAVETAFMRWEALQNNAPLDAEISQAVTRRTAA